MTDVAMLVGSRRELYVVRLQSVQHFLLSAFDLESRKLASKRSSLRNTHIAAPPRLGSSRLRCLTTASFVTRLRSTAFSR